MNKKLIITFCTGLLSFYALLHGVGLYLKHRQEKAALKQTQLIQENVKDRFRIFLDLPLSIGMAGADYFSSGDLMNTEYGPHADDLLKINKEILGLNLLDDKGTIIRVFPEEVNQHTVGKTSQNFQQFHEHYLQGHSYWFSSPFKLYQGQMGFVFYVPITKDKKLKGWFAPVLSSNSFFEKFKLSELLHSFDLIIKDKESGLDYFASGMLPESTPKIYQSEVNIMGRPLVFQMWRKENEEFFNFPWYLNLATASVLSMLLVSVVWLQDARRKAHLQLEDISILLRLTSKDALAKLIDDESSVADKNTYLNNLLEQIDLLQTMARSGEGPDQEVQYVAPLMREQLQNLEEVISKKSLIISFSETSFSEGKVFANRWLLQNCILCNSLVHSILYARPECSIVLSYENYDETNIITIHTSKILGSGDPFKMDRRLEVARKVVAIYQGEFFLQKDLSEGMIIRIRLPMA